MKDQMRTLTALGDRIERLQNSATLQEIIKSLRKENEALRSALHRPGPQLQPVPSTATEAPSVPALRGRPPRQSTL
jgi:hypothetical protein